jgi:hypothetical protein
VLLVLVILPNGSRSLIPAAWTDWSVPHTCGASSCADDIIPARALGKLGDLLALCKIIDALQRRHIEAVPQAESSDATEPSLFRSPDPATSPTPSRRSPIVWDQLDEAARIAALELLARMIARMMGEVAVKGIGHE